MRQRRARLLRLVGLFEIVKRARDTRLARLSNEDARLARREMELLATASAPSMFGLALQQMSNRRLAAIACERGEIRRKIDAENAKRLDAERRARAAARALERVDTMLEGRGRRIELEEIRLGPGVPPASPTQAPPR